MLQKEQGVNGSQTWLLISSDIASNKILTALVLVNKTCLAVGRKSWAKLVGLEKTSRHCPQFVRPHLVRAVDLASINEGSQCVELLSPSIICASAF